MIYTKHSGNGQEIDRIKGVDAKGPPKDEWLKRQDILPSDPPEVRQAKYYHNSLLLVKKPYFFRYLYEDLNTEYKKKEHDFNIASQCNFGIKLKKLMAKPNKTDAEKNFLHKYYKQVPVLTTECTMNTMCRMFEDIDFDIQYRKEKTSMLPHYDLSEFTIDPDKLIVFRDMYRKFCNKTPQMLIHQIYKDTPEDDYKDLRCEVFELMRDEIREMYDTLNVTPMEALTYTYALSQSYVKFNWDFAWDIIGDQILDCIEAKPALAPVEDPDGEEFLGRKYKLIEVAPTPTEAPYEIVDIETELNK